MATDKKFKDGLGLDDLVAVELPVHIWYGMISELSAQQILGPSIAQAMFQIQREMLHPHILNEYDAARQREIDQAEKIRLHFEAEHGLGLLDDSDPRKPD